MREVNTSGPNGYGSLEYYINVKDSPLGNLVFEMVRKIEGVPFTCEYFVSRDSLGLSDEQFSNLNKTLHFVLKQLSFSLRDYIQNKLK